MKRDSLDNWKKFGKTDPYFGVLSDEKYKTENNTEEGLTEFFETGEVYVNETAERIKQAFSVSLDQASILDFGWGVGRLAIPFSRITNKEVVGLDISPDIIEKAKEHALTFERKNVGFQAYDGKNLPEFPPSIW